MMTVKKERIPLMALAMLALLLAIWGGLQRIGVFLPVLSVSLPFSHGPLMIGAFLGTLIGLERAVARGKWWGYGAPLFCGLGGAALVFGLPGATGAGLITLGSGVLLAIFAGFVRRQPTLYMGSMALGVLCWIAGNMLWLAGEPFYRVVFLWAGFLIFTIAGERLELSRLLRLTTFKQITFGAATLIVLTGAAFSPAQPEWATRVFGAGLIGLTVWLYRYDIARRTVRSSGLTRFIAVSLLCGYAWLAVGGILALVFGAVVTGPYYDALLHAIFLGFVFSMIFGHAPVIFPAVLGTAIAYRAAFYSHLALLHLSVALRVAGDLSGWAPGRQWGAIGNAAAILLFLANTVVSAVRAASVKANSSGSKVLK